MTDKCAVSHDAKNQQKHSHKTKHPHRIRKTNTLICRIFHCNHSTKHKAYKQPDNNIDGVTNLQFLHVLGKRKQVRVIDHMLACVAGEPEFNKCSYRHQNDQDNCGSAKSHNFQVNVHQHGNDRINKHRHLTISLKEVDVGLNCRLHQSFVDYFLLVELLFQRLVLGFELFEFVKIVVFHDKSPFSFFV